VNRIPPRVIALIVVVVVVVLGVGAYAVQAVRRHQHEVSSAPTVASTELAGVMSGPHIVFRNTLPGPQYGLVAAVPLGDPSGARAFTPITCDRVDVAGAFASCLRTVSGVATTFETDVYDVATWQRTQTWPLPGIPSRTRLSDDGTLVGTTAFVTGDSYATVGFSTRTEIHSTADGSSRGDLESWHLTVDGKPFTASDRNIWGVTFVDDDTIFVTAASHAAGKTWLMTGSIASQTLTSVVDNAECPSVSPDKTKVAYKKVVDTVNGQPVWAVAVRDIHSGSETLIPSTKGLDDQVEWLDDSTLLYGLPRTGQAGTTDVYSVGTTADAQPSLFISGAWSPSVVR
jgi:hypothetical protein